MAIAQKLAGYTLGNADLLRRAMGKKKKSVLDARVRPLPSGMKANGLLRGVDQGAVGHAACRSPTTRSTRRTPRPTAWCPTGPPTSRPTTRPSTWPPCSPAFGDDKDKSALYLGECRRMGIKVLPPDVNDSIGQFTAVGTDIRFGLRRSATSAHNVVEAIVAAREEKGRFTSFQRLPAQGAGRGLQQAHHRVAHQGRCLRLAGRDPDGPDPGARGVRRRGRRGQAPGGHRPGLPLRVVRRRLGG